MMNAPTRNDECTDAQSRAGFGAQSVRTSVTMGACYLGSWPLSMITQRAEAFDQTGQFDPDIHLVLALVGFLGGGSGGVAPKRGL
jgi:hypothetical protein